MNFSRTSLDLSNEMHCILDNVLQIQYINPAFLNVLPFDAQKLDNLSFLDLLLPEERNQVSLFFKEITTQSNQVLKCGLLNTLNDKVQLNAKVCLDITEKTFHVVGQVQLERENTLARFKRFFDLSLLNMMVVLNKSGKFALANKGFLETMGFEWADLEHISALNIVHQESHGELRHLARSLAEAEGTVHTVIFRCVTKQNIFKWISWRIIYVKEFYYATANDITEIKAQEIEIQSLLRRTISLNETLEMQNEELTQKEEQQRMMVTDLQNALSELEVRNFELDQFVYKTSHDLRAPLTSILGLVNIAKIDSHDVNRLMEYFLMIEKSTLKLEQFINSLLEYLKAGRSEIQSQKIDFYEVVNGCLEDLKYVKNAKKLHTSVTSEGAPNFYNDLLRIKIIFNNIISNAVKYQLDRKHLGSYLRIHLNFTNPDHITITFKDNGIGIEKEYLNRIFDMFFRATEKSEGAGLGMYIVKQTVLKLNGTIAIDSRYGEGTEITLTIPNVLNLS